MAVVDVKSGLVTELDAVVKSFAASAIARGAVRVSRGTLVATSGDSIGSTYRLARIKSSDYVLRVLLSCDAITSGAANVGLYRTEKDGGAVVDADFFASAQSIASALSQQNITHESAVFNLNHAETPVWEALGLSADPKVEYDVVATLTAAAAATGDVALSVEVLSDE
jgi:hypothetical protein